MATGWRNRIKTSIGRYFAHAGRVPMAGRHRLGKRRTRAFLQVSPSVHHSPHCTSYEVCACVCAICMLYICVMPCCAHHHASAEVQNPAMGKGTQRLTSGISAAMPSRRAGARAHGQPGLVPAVADLARPLENAFCSATTAHLITPRDIHNWRPQITYMLYPVGRIYMTDSITDRYLDSPAGNLSYRLERDTSAHRPTRPHRFRQSSRRKVSLKKYKSLPHCMYFSCPSMYVHCT